MPNQYTAEEKLAVCEYARTHTCKQTRIWAIRTFGVSPCIDVIRKWCIVMGFKPKADKIGAPLGNNNQLGGRILNTKKILTSCPLHRKG